MIYFVAAVAAIAGFLFGFDEGIIAGALPILQKQFSLTAGLEGFMTASVPLGAFFGAIAASRLADGLGRRRVLMGAAILFTIGTIGAALITAMWMLVLARFCLGLAIGISSMVAPMYIAETAPARNRGLLISIFQLAITIGILSSYLTSLGLLPPMDAAADVLESTDAWRWMFATGLVPAVLLLMGMMVVPESPRWLVKRGQPDEARAALARVRAGSPESAGVDGEIQDIRAAIAEEKSQGGWGDLFKPIIRPALVVGMGLFLLQQLSGINAVIYYAPAIFKAAGFDTEVEQIEATVIIGLVNVLTTVLAMWLVDRIGRRPLLLLGFAGTAVAMAILALGVVVPTGDGAAPEAVMAPNVLLGAVIMYIFFFAISIGPLPWVMMSEVFPLNVRAVGMSMAAMANWGFNFLVVFLFPVLMAGIGANTFWIFSVVCALGVVFTLIRVPETKGVSLEQIEHHIHAGKPLRELGK